MRYLLCFVICCFAYTSTEAQFTVNFKLGKYPLFHLKDSIFIAGSFNNWNPNNSAYSLSAADVKEISFYVKLDKGVYEYKATRGDWNKVECMNLGVDIDNHSFEVNGDTSITINVEAWKDDFAATLNKHTATKQVQVMDTAFFIPQLNRTRRIWIYLPEGYEKSKKRYPVLYMHDGQNLFDAATAAFAEWGIDEYLDSVIKTGKPPCILVGIDNGPQRMSEYNPYEFRDFGKGEADAYISFLTETLKPAIDKRYRTLTDKDNTIIAGSSMGGLVSYYAMLQKPGVFGKAGIFSPSFWTAPLIKALTDSLAVKVSSKFFFYIGEKEGDNFVKDMTALQDRLGERSSAMIYAVLDPEGQHNEKAWRKWFAEFYTWIMADGYNTIIKLDN